MPDPTSPTPIADALVLCMTRGMSLGEWERLGLLEREWSLYEHIADAYRQIVVLSYGEAEGEERVAGLLSPAPIVVTPADAPDAPANVAEALGDARSVVVKTNQMDGVEAAIRTAHHLRSTGRRVGLIARGGYLRSRFAADQFGPASRQAADAAADERAICEAADVVVGSTPDMAHALAWRYGVAFERTRVIPNYVMAMGPSTCACDRKPIVLYAGQLVKRKRVDMLLRATARLSRETATRLTFSIIGQGPEEAALKELAADLGVNAVFEARIEHSKLQDRMRQAAIYAQASALEGHPKTVIEAMACGAAVVVTDSPGMGEVITHGVTGLRVEPHEGALGDAIDLLMNDEEWREQMGHAAAHAAQERFGLHVIGPLEEAAHRAAIESGGEGVGGPAGVRWDPALVEAGHGAAEAWALALGAFAKRLDAGETERMLMRLEQTTRDMREQVAGAKRASA
ncbi:MAG: glycosyltransferase family 4 protein [Phycisphaeraceae bacterium]|nr:glycosyltransferase family 4 protein [Phycisphaeraceae bacterium]